jgi:thiol:disulfide interchange protein
MVDIVQAFLQQAAAKGAKSTVLNPLAWLIVILFAGISGGLYLKSPAWLLILIAVFLSLSVGAYLVSYGYFALKSPDSLRSERFTISKMVIEKSIKGDSLVGLIDPSLQVDMPLLPTTSKKPEEESDGK